MDFDDLTPKEKIVEFLVANREVILEEVERLRSKYNHEMISIPHVFKQDLTDQYEARIRQHIAFTVADQTGIAIEYVIIEIETTDLQGYLDV